MPNAPRFRARSALSLVEVVVALTLLALGLVGLAGVGAASLRRVALTSARETAVRLAHNRLGYLLAFPCGATASGATTGTFAEQWNVSAAGARRAATVRVRFTIGGVSRDVTAEGLLPC